MGNEYANRGDDEMAIKLWHDSANMFIKDPHPHINLYNYYRSKGNLRAALQEANLFLNSYQTANTSEFVTRVKADIQEMQKQLNPQPQQPPPVPK